jgi:Asp-tRNA(Asn)/Glu-tRNA(Gln) amidotransferase A subunit family amidase
MNLAELSAARLARMIDGGEITSSELIEACLSRIEAREDEVRAWTHLDRDFARKQAAARDASRAAGEAFGPLHGIPVGIKDIFDTRDFPTENGSVLHAGRQPHDNCTVVDLLLEAGAVIMGKTVTTEFAFYSPGKTANPHNPGHTPGGSSSGSAAAVATGMVPLAVGSQTNGSVIRPAAFCGVFGYKPTHGLISRHRVLKLSRSLDTMGVFARTLEDMALIGESLMAFDSHDPDMHPRARPRIRQVMAEEPPVDPRLAFVRSPVWDQAEETTKDAFRELCEHLGEHVDVVDLPPMFDEAHKDQGLIMAVDMANSLSREYDGGKDKLSPVLRELIEKGRSVLAADYTAAVGRIGDYSAVIDGILADYDAILTPAAPGEAPVGLDATGNPSFCTIWTLCGVPAVNLPVLQGPAGMPVGAQLVSNRGDDARLFRNGRWVLGKLAEE